MGLFKGAKNTYKKSEAAVIVQNLLSEDPALSDLQGQSRPKELATTLVEGVWKQKSDIFEGQFGQRPHKLAVASIALANGLGAASSENSSIDTVSRGAMAFALGRALLEVETNGQLYSLSSMDWELINKAIETHEQVGGTEALF